MEHSKHRELKKILLFEEGGLLIRFKDNSHTYIEPDILKEILEEYNKLNIK